MKANTLKKTETINADLKAGIEVIKIEAEAVASLANRLNEDFITAVDLLYNCKGRVVVSGVGKSGVIGRKISATLCSTGTPAIFLHASDGLHGDLGMVQRGDIVIWISKSGNSDEFKESFPLLRKIGVKVIAISGTLDSQLAKSSDVVLDVSVAQEACPNDLAPTASTTATLAMGDALAIAVLKKRNFTSEDFAYLHPGGSLGKKLLLKTEDIMYVGSDLPVVNHNDEFRKIMVEMNTKRFGATCVTDDKGVLAGIITDGDLKRLMTKNVSLDILTAKEIMSKSPKTIDGHSLAAKAMHIMKQFDIMQIIVVDDNKKPVGILHLHDLLNEGIY